MNYSIDWDGPGEVDREPGMDAAAIESHRRIHAMSHSWGDPANWVEREGDDLTVRRVRNLCRMAFDGFDKPEAEPRAWPQWALQKWLDACTRSLDPAVRVGALHWLEILSATQPADYSPEMNHKPKERAIAALDRTMPISCDYPQCCCDYECERADRAASKPEEGDGK